MRAILGKKIGMTTLYDSDNRAVPVTVVQAGPCKVVQVKTNGKEGYSAIQVAFDPLPEKKITAPVAGHFEGTGWKGARFVREFRVDPSSHQVGSELTVEQFSAGDQIKVTGTSKGKGFMGVMARHNFGGGPETHGSMSHRRPGSMGMSSFPARVKKNQRMGGHTGSARVSIAGLTVYAVDSDNNLLIIKGAVPGSNGTYLVIQG